MANSSEPESAQLVGLRARLRLLQSLTSRGSSEIAALLIPPVLLWVSTRSSPDVTNRLACWWALMAVMVVGLMLFRRRLHRQWLQAHTWGAGQLGQALPLWQRQLALVAFINGLMWAAMLGFTWQGSHFELRMLVMLVLAGVMASAATFLAPVLPVFAAFMAGIYVPTLLAMLGYFPNRGPYLLSLLLLYGVILGRHAWGARRFVQQQIAYEVERQALAERYREAQMKAERALAEKNWFVSAASHDLRQPLHALGLMLEAARQRNQDAQVLPLLQEIQACTRDLGGMFNDLMDLSRLDGDGFAPQWQAVDIAVLLEEAQRLFARDAAQRGLRLRMRLPRKAVVLRTDAVLLRQMVFNLLQNALRYTEKGGVLLALRRRRGRCLLQVWDSGNGLSEKEQTQVFTRHYRSSHSQARDALAAVPAPFRGRGLGLSVLALAAQRLGVEYGVQSQPGKGSCFWLCWPEEAEQVPEVQLPAMQQSRGDAPSDGLQGRCLLVQAAAQRSPVLQALMQSWGVQVRSATSLTPARQLAVEWAPDFVLCDQLLDDEVSGLECLMQLLEQCPAAGGALLSDELLVLEHAQDQGYLALAKPLQSDQLYELLARCMGSVRR